MSKITQYLNEHLLGEVTSNESVRQRFARDGSILTIKPEIVVSPRVTNDIRKVARFSWQLAEKGHVLPITARGGGSNQTGAAIGKGIIINTLAHLNKIIFVNIKGKDQFAHVQPGVVFDTLNETLKSHGMIIPSYPKTSAFSTVGGAIANNSGGSLSGKFGQVGDWVKRLEVVLANGDLIETSRISRRDLSKKKGLQSFEGELYRKIDAIIDDNQSVIADQISTNAYDNTGYPGIAKVKQRDGSFDLTPLIIGSQGTLGIISEAVLKTDYYNKDESIVVATFADVEMARDAADIVMSLQPVSLELIDGEFFNIAKSYGKKYAFNNIESEKPIQTVLFAVFNDYSASVRRRKLKQSLKRLSKFGSMIITSDNHSVDDLYAIRDVSAVVLQPESSKETLPSLIDGAAIPADRREDFMDALSDLASRHHVELPTITQWMDGIISTRPVLQLHQVSDKQKTFKLISEYTEIVTKFGGYMSAEFGEGRLRSYATHGQLPADVVDIYDQIRLAFDPFGTLNPGVKQKSDIKTLISQLNSGYEASDFSMYSPRM